MAVTAKVQLNTDQLLADLSRARVETLLNLAEAVAQKARENITENDQLDTGFLRASIYYVVQVAGGARHSTYDETWADGKHMSRRHNRMEQREKAPEADLEGGAVGLIGAAANYAEEQELKQSFLYKAAEDVNLEEIVAEL